MPIRIQCPTCQASLSMPETMYGKAVRCPTCQSPFQCPPAPVSPRHRPGPPPAPAARAAGTPSVDVERGPTSAAPDLFVDDRDRKPQRAPGWDRLRSGIVYFFFSTLCFFLYAALTFALIIQ